MRWMMVGLMALGAVACEDDTTEQGRSVGSWQATELTSFDDPRTFDIGAVPFRVVSCQVKSYGELCSDISAGFNIYDDRLCRAGDPESCELWVDTAGDRLLIWRVVQ